jgi:ribonuclease P protein component
VATALWRLSDPAAFARLRTTRHRVRSGPVWVAWVPAPASAPVSPPRVAFAVGKAVGGAVVRNRLRRQLRAVLVVLRPAPGDYLVGVRPEAAALSFSELNSLVSGAFGSLATSVRAPVAG